MLKKLKQKLKKVDIFGWPAEINFSEDRKTHKTLLGGFISMWVLSGLWITFFVKVNTMVFREND